MESVRGDIMKYRIIKVFEDSCDYQYENLFLVRCNDKQVEDFKKFQEKVDELYMTGDLEEEYGGGKIECIEDYIVNNFEVLDVDYIDVDCY